MRRLWLRTMVAGVALAGAAAAPACAQEGAAVDALVAQKNSKDVAIPTFGFEARWWFFTLDGTTQLTDRDINGQTLRGTVLDFGKEYELDTANSAPEAVAELKFSKGWGVTASYMEMGSEGSRFLDQGFNYDGQQFNVGDYVSTALNLRYGTILARWMILENVLGLHVGPTLGCGYVRFDQTVERTSGVPAVTQTVHETGRSPLPLIGVSARFGFYGAGVVKFDASGGYIAYDGNRGAWFDSTLGIYWLPKEVIGIGGGIRFLHIDLTKLELDKHVSWAAGRFTLFGVYLGLEVRL